MMRDAKLMFYHIQFTSLFLIITGISIIDHLDSNSYDFLLLFHDSSITLFQLTLYVSFYSCKLAKGIISMYT